MKVKELKFLLTATAAEEIPIHYRHLVRVVGNESHLSIKNSDTDVSAKVLAMLGQQSVTFSLSRRETLSNVEVLRTFDEKMPGEDAELAPLVGDVDNFINREIAVLRNNVKIALNGPNSSIADFLEIAERIGEVDLENKPLSQPQALHDRVLQFLLEYRSRNPEFRFWLREKNIKNRLNQGYWFQGTETYAFVGLYNAWAGNQSTKSVGLVFWPNRSNDIEVSFTIIFRGEQDQVHIKLYDAFADTLKQKHGNQLSKPNDHQYTLELNGSFDAASSFLDEYRAPFNNLVVAFGLQEIFIQKVDFERKLDRILEIRRKIQSGNIADLLPVEKGEEVDFEEDPPVAANQSNTNVKLQLDTPTLVDELGRKPFVDALFEYIKRLWQDESRKDSYTIHINGEWGSGKSSILGFLKEKMEAEKGKTENRWIVVEFNAWQNQHIQLPWWIFLNTVYKSIKERSSWKRSIWLFIRESFWRLISINAGKWITLVVLLIILGWTVIDNSFLDFNSLFQNDSGNKVNVILSILSLGGSVWLIFYSVINSLLAGSEEAAKSYKLHVSDPMEKIKKHYKSIINYTKKNVAVFIDDIDRCDPKVVVQLLEGLQTLFRTGKVLYIIAGDGAWIRESFEIHYGNLKETVKKPGQSLGNFFVEKTLQQSVNLPPITEEIKKLYWNSLLNGQRVAEQGHEDQIAQIKSASSESEMADLIKNADSDAAKTAMREAAAKKISSKEILKEIEHELLKYHDLLEPNPRSMKRLVNNIALEKASNFLGGINDRVDQDKLIKWAILRNRYPLIAIEIKRNKAKLFDYKKQETNKLISQMLEGVSEDMLQYMNG